MKKIYLIMISVALTTLAILGGNWLYNNYTAKGGAVVLITDKVIEDERFLVEINYQPYEVPEEEIELVEVHPSAWNLIVVEEEYEISYHQRFFDKYKRIINLKNH
ncbi:MULTISPECIES: hypothetical protein [Allobacillus]|uniref:Uncharacterized protein n=1 Tax=Allobacillus salarius TaxID=1955272 RepID=A0A556PPD9_9BACI|nr:hypothetical protein [Allobacillus salarius]TSJ66260.1 hypothetical protein FPQ13_05180 [Allobacillus salarius]